MQAWPLQGQLSSACPRGPGLTGQPACLPASDPLNAFSKPSLDLSHVFCLSRTKPKLGTGGLHPYRFPSPALPSRKALSKLIPSPDSGPLLHAASIAGGLQELLCFDGKKHTFWGFLVCVESSHCLRHFILPLVQLFLPGPVGSLVAPPH